MLTLRVIFFFLFSFLPNRFYSDNVDLHKQNDISNDNEIKGVGPVTKKDITNTSLHTATGEVEEKEAGDVDDPTAGFYRAAYADFRQMYNTDLSPAEKKYLKCEDEEGKSTLRSARQITLRGIRDGDSWGDYKRMFYSSDKYFLYRPVHELYSPYEVLFYSSFSDRDCSIETKSGYRRFDFLKRSEFDMPINDTKSPIVRISSAVDVYQSTPRGYISSVEYSFSANRNTHLGFVCDIVPLTRFYNRIYFCDLKEDDSEDMDKPPYSYNFNYLFFSPFYSYALYKSDDERFVSYFHVSYKNFKVDESGGSSIKEGVANASFFFYEGSRASKFDIITSLQQSFSAFFFSQYKFVGECRCYFLFDISKEKNEVEIKKDTDAILPSAIRSKMDTQKGGFKRNNEDYYKYFYITDNTIGALGLGDKNLKEKKQYSSSSQFSKGTFDIGFENIPFLFFNFDIFAKLSICLFPFKIREYIDGEEIKNEPKSEHIDGKKIENESKSEHIADENGVNKHNYKSFDPIVGFTIRRGCVKLGAEMLFKDLKFDPYFKCLLEVKKKLFLQLLKITAWINRETAHDILNSTVDKLAGSKSLYFWMYLLSKKLKIKDIFSFSFLTRILLTIAGSEVENNTPSNSFSISNEKKQNPVTGSIKNDSLVTCNFGLKFKIKITKHFFTRALIFFNKKESIDEYLPIFFTRKRVQRDYNNLPLFSCFVKIYYKRRIGDDNSFLAYGLRVRYDTPCHLDEFNIIKQQWCYHEEDPKEKDKLKKTLPVIDLFLNLRLGWFDISWEATDLIQAFSGYTSILSPYYLRKPWSLFSIIISFVTLN